MGACKLSLSAIKVQTFSVLHLFLDTGPPLLDDLIFASDDLRQIDADFAGMHTPLLRMAGVVSHLRAGDHRLSRRAPGVDAGSPQLRLFDEGHIPPVVRQLLRERVPRLPRTNYDSVKFRHGGSLRSSAQSL